MLTLGLLTLAATAMLTVSACSGTGEDGQGSPEGGWFISDDPNNGTLDDTSNGADGGTATGSSSSSSSSGEGGAGGSGAGGGDPGDPEKIIAEADIIQVHSNLLYALSEYSGLSIIDVSVPDQLTLVGHNKLPGRPFEMYLRDGVVYAMFSSWGHYEEVAGYWQWVETSHLEALNVTNPGAIVSVGSFDMPGSLADSRMVGDVIYVVTFEDGYCWQCAYQPNTTVTSLDVADPANVAVVDQLSFTGDYSSWQRSISVTTDRMYVGGIDWSSGNGDTSTIQVVDISSPTGVMQLGDEVTVAGQIQSRWQMSEHENVLRVISQPWSPFVNPRVQTFAIASSFSLSPLGETELLLPQPESLRAVRFDGNRAYAITAEVVWGDPLYTVDLSDPANPQMVGMLEMPGWVYHIEPRGDRLLALGFDEQNPEGSLNLSLFDVADLTNPLLLRRVAFGGDWGSFAEDQDRIHKAFTILPEIGLVLVPYSAWSWDDYSCHSYQSGVQLIDYVNDDITLRGVAPVRGDARRAFMHQDRLFAMSDEQVRTFDISNRDAPQKSAELLLATHVNQVVVQGSYIVRMAADWWTSEPRLEVVPAAEPDAAQPVGSVDLGPMLATAEQDDSCYYWSYWDVRLYAHGQSVFLVWPSWYGQTARVAGVDLSDPTQPRLGPHLDVSVDRHSYYGWYWGYAPALLATGDPVAQVGSTLAFLKAEVPLDEWGYPTTYPTIGTSHSASLQVVDLADVDSPQLAATVSLPPGGGHTGLVTQGQRVLLTHWEPLPSMPGKARFFLDRVDLSSPSAPALLSPVNVPGSLVAFDESSSHLLTVDYQRTIFPNVTRGFCYETFNYNAQFYPHDAAWWQNYDNWEDVLGQCWVMHRELKLVQVRETAPVATLLDHYPLPDSLNPSRLLPADDRVFFTSSPYYYNDETESYVWVIGGLRAGSLEVRREPIADDDPYGWSYWQPIEAEDQRLVAYTWYGGVVSVDAGDLDNLTIKTHATLPWYVYSAEIDGDQAFISLGHYGLQVVSLVDDAAP